MSRHICVVCKKHKKNMFLKCIETTPRHIRSFKVDPIIILTTICEECFEFLSENT